MIATSPVATTQIANNKRGYGAMRQFVRRISLACGVAIMLSLGFLAVSSQAEACCIYNNTKYLLFTNHLGDWTIGPSDHRCTEGTGGKVALYLMDDSGHKRFSNTLTIEVDKHGWVSVYKKSGESWRVVSKRKDGSVKDVKYLEAKDNGNIPYISERRITKRAI